MTLTFTLSGSSSEISNTFHPPIDLDEGADYEIALLRIDAYNSIPNITENNNSLVVVTNEELGKQTIKIPKGTYEISHISDYVAEKLKNLANSTRDPDSIFRVSVNPNTLLATIYSTLEVSFDVTNSVGPLLGFDTKDIIPKSSLLVSKKPPDINEVNIIRVECNIASGSFLNGRSTHTIYEFFPTVPPGYKICEVPANLIFLPLVNIQKITDITISLVDQKGRLIDFRGERVSVRVAIRKKNGA